MPVAQKKRQTSNRMRERILLECAKLFALDSYAAVSMRDIAQVVGIKSSSIYNYFDSKEDLLGEILLQFEREYGAYFVWLNEINKDVSTLEELMDNMFIKLLDVDDPFTYYGMVIVLKEQFTHPRARDIAFRLFHKENVRCLQTQFDRLSEIGAIPPCNTEAVATFFMHNVLIGTELRIHELLDHAGPVDCTEMYLSLKSFLIGALSQGVPAI